MLAKCLCLSGPQFFHLKSGALLKPSAALGPSDLTSFGWWGHKGSSLCWGDLVLLFGSQDTAPRHSSPGPKGLVSSTVMMTTVIRHLYTQVLCQTVRTLSHFNLMAGLRWRGYGCIHFTCKKLRLIPRGGAKTSASLHLTPTSSASGLLPSPVPKRARGPG